VLGIRKIPREDLFGLFFVRKSYGTNWDSYYGTIDALRPLLESEDFSKIVSGFYTSHINESVRISYFVKIDKESFTIHIQNINGQYSCIPLLVFSEIHAVLEVRNVS